MHIRSRRTLRNTEDIDSLISWLLIFVKRKEDRGKLGEDVVVIDAREIDFLAGVPRGDEEK